MLFSELPLNSIVRVQSSNFDFFGFMSYEGVEIPIYKHKTTYALHPITSLVVHNNFEDNLTFSTMEQILDYFVSKNIHVGVHNGKYYLYASVNENFISHGYFSVRPMSSSFGLFGLSWNSYNSELELFSGVRSGESYFDSRTYESLFDSSLTISAYGFLYFFRINSVKYDQFINDVWGDLYNYDVVMRFYGYLIYPCCYPDFSPIVHILGGTPSTDQAINLESICDLLGADTVKTGFTECDLMKKYLENIVFILGGTPLIEPNDNLKSICQLLGADISDNGLIGCELSKEYVKRIGVILGVQYA